MGTTTSASDEWLELYNNSASDIDLDGWHLIATDGVPDIALSGTIPAGGRLLLERTDENSVADHTADMIYTGGLENGGEVITLTNDVSDTIDVVDAWHAGNNSLKATMVRTDLTGDGTNAASWSDGQIGGTPTNSIVDGDADTFGYSPNINWIAGSGFEAFDEDCDDSTTTTSTYPGASEALNIIDDDCDQEIDEDFILAAFGWETHFNTQDVIYATGTTVATNALEEALLAHIDDATTSLDVAIYGFSRASFKDALIAAHNRGVMVRVVADHSQYSGSRNTIFNNSGQSNQAAYLEALGEQSVAAFFTELETAGITVIPSNYISYLQHNKFLVKDGQTVWTGSMNWTNSGVSYNANNAIVLTSTHIAKAYQIEFNEMFVDGTFATAKVDNTPHVFNFSNGTIEIYFSPSDGVESQVIDVINNTVDDMQFSLFFWTSDTLGQLVASRYMTDGLDIWGVFDAVGATNAYSEDETLCDAGIPVKIELAGGKSHNKYAVFDHAGVNPVVVTGSYNWTASGDESNDENTLVIKNNSAIAQRYYDDISFLYNALPASVICQYVSAESGLAACSDGIDNDFDGDIDENDSGCQESTFSACTDGVDNDGDTLTDGDDPDCWLMTHIPTAVNLQQTAAAQAEPHLTVLPPTLLLILTLIGFFLWKKRSSYCI